MYEVQHSYYVNTYIYNLSAKFINDYVVYSAQVHSIGYLKRFRTANIFPKYLVKSFL